MTDADLTAVVAGPDCGLREALREHGVEVSSLGGVLTASRLRDAGIEDADVFVLTDASEATAIPIALDENPDLRVVVYDTETVPEFVRGQLDLAIDPALLDADAVADEITR